MLTIGSKTKNLDYFVVKVHEFWKIRTLWSFQQFLFYDYMKVLMEKLTVFQQQIRHALVLLLLFNYTNYKFYFNE